MAEIEIGDAKAWTCLSLKDNTPEGIYITNTKDDGGIGVMVYVKDGQPVGVTVHDTTVDDESVLVSAWGWVPASELE